MNPVAADALIREFANLGADIKALQAKRAAIVAQFPKGRTEGEELALYVSGRGYVNVLSMTELKRYVRPAVIARCTHRKLRNGSARVVAKAKPKGNKK